MEYNQPLVRAMAELDENALMAAMEDVLSGPMSMQQIEGSLQEGLKQVGVRFAEGQYYLADMIVGGDLYQEAMTMLISRRRLEPLQQKKGKVLIGVMKDDIHDIGKDIVRMLLTLDGFDVMDLGVDVPTEEFISAVQSYQPDIIALCGVMTFSARRMMETIQRLGELPNRASFRIIVGGSCIDEKTALDIGADGFTRDAYNVSKLCAKLMEELKAGS